MNNFETWWIAIIAFLAGGAIGNEVGKAKVSSDKGENGCKYCGTEKLHWEKWDSRWRLYDDFGQLHSCDEYGNC